MKMITKKLSLRAATRSLSMPMLTLTGQTNMNRFRIKFGMTIGFTLAEVLITLGIIGVVAAMTIPMLNNHLRGKKLQSQFMKTYSELNQAARNFYADTDMHFRDYQDSVYEGTMTSTKSLKLFMSYYKGVTTDTGWNYRFFDTNHGLKNLNLNNQPINQWPCDESNVFVDIVGRLYTMDNNAKFYNLDVGPKICVDINGKDKPNKWGVDRFVFVFTENNAIVPYTGNSWSGLRAQMTDETQIANYCNSSMTNVAHTCAYFALKNKSPEGSGDYWYDFLRGK